MWGGSKSAVLFLMGAATVWLEGCKEDENEKRKQEIIKIVPGPQPKEGEYIACWI